MSFLQRLAERGGISGNGDGAAAKRAQGVVLPDTASRPWFTAMDRPANEPNGDPMDVPRLRRHPVRTAEGEEKSVDAGRRRDAGVGARDHVGARPALRAPVDIEAHLVSSITPLPAAAPGGDDANGRFIAGSPAGPVPSRVSSPSRREAARVRADTAPSGSPAMSPVADEEQPMPTKNHTPRSKRRAPVGAPAVPRPASTLEMVATPESFRDEGDPRVATRDHAIASPASDGASRRRASPLPPPLLTPLRPDTIESRGTSELDRSTSDGSRNARMRASHDASPPLEARVEPPQRAVSIHIGTIEIRESPPAAPTAAPRPTPARSAGFEEFAALRAYAPWRGR